MLSGEAERQCELTCDDIIKKSSVPWVAVMEGLTGVTLDDIIDSLPKGSTPNRYKPHQGCKEMERRAKKLKGQS